MRSICHPRAYEAVRDKVAQVRSRGTTKEGPDLPSQVHPEDLVSLWRLHKCRDARLGRNGVLHVDPFGVDTGVSKVISHNGLHLWSEQV